MSRNLLWTAGLPSAFFLLIYFIYAWAPENSPDGVTYHLGILGRELRAHGFERITTKFYAMLGQGVELAYLPAFVIGRNSAAALTHLVFSLSLVFSIFCFGRRIGKPWIGAAAAVFTFVSPVFGLDSSTAYVDAATAAIVFATFYWLEIWDAERKTNQDAWRLLIPVGLMAGYAFAAKFTAFTIGVYALGFVAIQARRFRPIVLVATCALLMGGPWVARNWIVYSNPIAPIGNAIFRNPYVHVMFEQGYRENMSRYGVADLWTLPLEVTIRGQNTTGLLGPLFLLLPLSLLALRTRIGRHVWIAGLLVSSTYLSNVGTRFLIPSLPFFSLSIAMAIGEAPMLLGILIVTHALTSWPGMIYYYADKYAWHLDVCPDRRPFLCVRTPLREALRRIDEETYLTRRIDSYAMARMIDRLVPKGEEVFGMNGIVEAYMEHVYRVSFESASNEVLTDILVMGMNPNAQATRVLSYRFPERTARAFRLEQTAKAAPEDPWNVHELRFLHKGVEVPRSPQWQLEAWPLPNDAQMAFDNSPFTRWRSWETAQPRMFIGADFGKDETIDEIRIETSPESWTVNVQPEIKNAAGAWEKLPAELKAENTPPIENARRAAAYAAHQHGLHYMVVRNEDYTAADINKDPGAWGLVQIGETPGMRLYKTIW